MYQKLMFVLFVLFSVLMSASANAVSYIDPAVSGIFANFGTDAGILGGYAWVLMGIILGTSIAIGLTRKFASKGAR